MAKMFDTLSPIVFATLQGCFLNAISNLLAQALTAYKTNAPYTIDWTPVVQFAIFTALNTPPNFLWQSYLESAFPSTYLAPSKSAASSSSKEKQPNGERKKSDKNLEPTLAVGNTAIKFLLDQTFGSAVNTIIYLIGFGGLSGKTWAESVLSVRNEFWGLTIAGWKVWPLVSIFNFAIIQSVEMRGLVGCLAGMGWGIYLSLKQGGGKTLKVE